MSRILCILRLALILGFIPTGLARVPIAAAQTASPPGRVSLWKGDASAADAEGRNPGVSSGGVSYAPGRSGTAFQFDGRSGQVRANPSPGLNVSAGDFSVVAWVYFDTLDHPPGINRGAPSGDMSLVDKMVATSGPNWNGWRLIKQHDNRIWLCFGGGPARNGCVDGSPTTVRSNTVVRAGRWYHVAGVKDAGAISLYVDGVLEASKPRPAFTDTHAADLRLGASLLEGAYLAGRLDEVALYSRALHPDEIRQLVSPTPMTCGPSVPPGLGVRRALVVGPARIDPGVTVHVRAPLFADDSAVTQVRFIWIDPSGRQVPEASGTLPRQPGRGDVEIGLSTGHSSSPNPVGTWSVFACYQDAAGVTTRLDTTTFVVVGAPRPKSPVGVRIAEGSAPGTVVSDPPGIACHYSGERTSGTCEWSFEVGSALTLQALPTAGATFSGFQTVDGPGCKSMTVSQGRCSMTPVTLGTTVRALFSKGRAAPAPPVGPAPPATPTPQPTVPATAEAAASALGLPASAAGRLTRVGSFGWVVAAPAGSDYALSVPGGACVDYNPRNTQGMVGSGVAWTVAKSPEWYRALTSAPVSMRARAATIYWPPAICYR